MKAIIQFDGLCEPVNPGGHGAWGFVLYINKERHEGHGYLGSYPKMSNNKAEWNALGFALRALLDHIQSLPEKEQKLESLTILGDSQLVIFQLIRQWQCKDEHMRKFRNRCLEIIQDLKVDDWVARWVPRDINQEADALSREGLRVGLESKEG